MAPRSLPVATAHYSALSGIHDHHLTSANSVLSWIDSRSQLDDRRLQATPEPWQMSWPFHGPDPASSCKRQLRSHYPDSLCPATTCVAFLSAGSARNPSYDPMTLGWPNNMLLRECLVVRCCSASARGCGQLTILYLGFDSPSLSNQHTLSSLASASTRFWWFPEII